MKRKVLFLLIVLEVTILDQLAPLFGACGKVAHHGRNTWQSKTAHLIARNQKTMEEVTGTIQSPSIACSQGPKDFPARSQSFYHLLIPGDQPFTTWAFGQHLRSKL